MPKICVLSQNTLKAYATDAITEWSKGVAGTNIKKKKKKRKKQVIIVESTHILDTKKQNDVRI